jgi:lambda repressor-like predicted transcriptional regulator
VSSSPVTEKDPIDFRIFALRRQGNTLREIGQAVGLAPSTVRDRLLQSGKFPGRIRLRNHLSQEKVQLIVSMYEKGSSLRRIGAEIGYSYETVRTVLRRSGRPIARRSITLTCSIKGCKGPHYALGYCQTHWTRSRNRRMDAGGNLIPLRRFCILCGREFLSPPGPPSGAKMRPLPGKAAESQGQAQMNGRIEAILSPEHGCPANK